MKNGNLLISSYNTAYEFSLELFYTSYVHLNTDA